MELTNFAIGDKEVGQFPIPAHRTWNIVDGSKLNSYATCPRMYFYEYVLGWRRDSANNHLIFGEAWHLAMEQLHLGGFDKSSVLMAYELFEAKYRETFDESMDDMYSPKNPSRAFDALVDYVKLYRDDDGHKDEVLKTEIAGTVAFDEQFSLHYRMDTIIRDKSRDLIFSREHKTGTNANQVWADQWVLAFQIWIYTHVLYCLYPPDQVRGVQINGIFFRKVKDNSKADKHAFLRVPCWKTPLQMQDGYETVKYYLNSLQTEFTMLQDAKASDAVMLPFPKNPQSCTKYFGCTWHDFCVSWANPLQQCSKPPLGFKQEWWDPAEKPAKETLNL